MQVPTAAQEFLELLGKSGLLTAAQIQRATETSGISLDMTAEASAKRLVRNRFLTPFQAERLLEGRYRGLVIDRYRIREILGFGGMGCVFIAEDPQEQKKVALKVLSIEHSVDAGMLARMKLEARAGMLLDHPNIVRTYRMDTTGALYFLVLQLVRGITLHELVALQGARNWQAVCDIGMQAAEGLAEAHRNGIVHRDIKPANFLIEKDGKVSILDFGLALMDGVEEEEFSLSMLFGQDCLGTPDYIAPEQSLDSRNVDGRADIYSLGATLYVALTARLPFPEKTNREKLEAQRTRQPRTVCEIRPDIPPEIGAIIARMMEKDPAKRFQTAAQLVAAFRSHAKRVPVEFDFRELVTLRANQAREKAASSPRRSSTSQRSSITSASGWIRGSNVKISDSTSVFGGGETPSIRQNVPEIGMATSAATPLPGTARGRQSVRALPTGWRIQILGQKQLQPLTRSRTTVGSSPNADVVLESESVDPLQCRLEFDGNGWQLKQESMTLPTYLNGEAASRGELKHNSRLTFGKKIGFRLVSLEQQEINGRRLQMAFGVVLVIIIIAAAVASWYR
ncbi:MAG: FHA domain-containing serine/threonine-protein kinase [Planctomyces sp.]